MRQSIYPDWFDVTCDECGETISYFCFTRKDRYVFAHFCEDTNCLETFYLKKYEGRKARYTIARLLAMRHNRNQRVEDYLRQQDNNDHEELFYAKPNEETMRRIMQRDEEYERKLRLHRGLRV